MTAGKSIRNVVVLLLTTGLCCLCSHVVLSLPMKHAGLFYGRTGAAVSTASATRLLTSARSSSRAVGSTASVAIVGGGLAGLSTAYHLLQKSPSLDITVFDQTAQPGLGGASSVAGGLLHPLSPRGKLVHRGLEGLACTNALIDAALQHRKDVVLQDEILRLAISDQHVSTLQKTAADYPKFTEWLPTADLEDGPETILGALRLYSGCKVIHVPTYLVGLWKACQSSGSGTKEWSKIGASSEHDDDDDVAETCWRQRLSGFDAVVFSAGSGLFQKHSPVAKDDPQELPIQLVRGQSVELTFSDKQTLPTTRPILCGKYISPLPDDRRLLIGATHEFKEEPLSPADVENEMKERTLSFAPEVWKHGTVDKITSGFRVQSSRGNFGRLPITGSIDSTVHGNAWIFTGLSSRGLLYHGLYGDILSDLMLGMDDVHDKYPEILWWRKRMEKRK